MPWLRSLLALALVVVTARAADWPQWLGPARNGSTPEVVAPWKEPLPVLWRQAVGEGHSSPVVAGSKVFLHTKVADKEQEAVTAFDASSGKRLWQTVYPRAAFHNKFGTGPRATPAVYEGHVYSLGVTGLLTCLDVKDGQKVWQVDTQRDYKAPQLFFGVSCSPLAAGRFVYVNVGGPGASVVAFDRTSGDAIWKSQDDRPSYASPILVTKPRQLVFLTQKGLLSLDPRSGEVFWRQPLQDLLLESSTTPVCAGDTLVASSITLGSVGVRLLTEGGRPAVKPLWKDPSLTCYFSTPVVVGKQLYLVTGVNPLTVNPFARKQPSASLRCVELASGKELWKKEAVGAYHASLVRTGDGKLLMVEEKGDCVLLEPDRRGYKEVCRSHVCGSTWSHPGIAGGRLYLRDNHELVCVQLKQ